MTEPAQIEMQSDGSATVVYAADAWGTVARMGRQPGVDISDLPGDLRAVIGAVWTPEFLNAYALAQAKARALASVVAAKEAALVAMSYVFGGQGYRVTLTAQDQINVMGAVQMLSTAPDGTNMLWEIVNSVFVTFGLSDIQALYGAGLGHVQACYANAAVLVAQVEAATTVAQVGAIDPTQGWPA